ncbi:unnamed protein product [Bursaphelenchus okinawaensis]|uniref:EF-hand domain-containing protein n=1 Tax=Bursaphelenchus okinawaensis TaxID=465554 RepID=A0A811LW20_9BILA|nr:unnamed protein product [Bursaphelenchus okinawaensis]CAG9128620.1 unnamed protein product [Bursaphelenchus okinawaensis]
MAKKITIAELRAIFDQYDADNDGVLGPKEALNAYKALGEKAKKIENFDKAFETIAKNKRMTLQQFNQLVQ